MNNPESSYTIEKAAEKKEREPNNDVPIIDVVRHGKTDYKELNDASFKFDPDAPDFLLDSEHLDLTEAGIQDVKRSAEQIVSSIEPDKEAVVLITSPNYRAQSSILLIEQVLKQKGITILNSSTTGEGEQVAEIKKSNSLKQFTMRDDELQTDWVEAHFNYHKKNPDDRASTTIAQRHKVMAASIGKEVADIFTKDHGQMGEEFKRWLRHMININAYLQLDTKSVLEGKRMRIIAVTHEERVDDFAKQALGPDTRVYPAQVLEINPDKKLVRGHSIYASVSLFGADVGMRKEGEIVFRFDKK